VYRFKGANIGYNPQDKFMVYGGDTLFVITDSGDVYGSAVDFAGQTIGPVVHFTGAKIGYNPQDKWMLAVEPPQIIQ
jgi:hypothetical protein